jgi:hypothetical protein
VTSAGDISFPLSDISTSHYVWVSGLDNMTGVNASGRWILAG